MVVQEGSVLFCSIFPTHISSARTFELYNVVSKFNFLSLYWLIELSCSLEEGHALKKQKFDYDAKEKRKMEGLDGWSLSNKVLQPPHFIFVRVDIGTATKRLTVAILLPSGVSPAQTLVRVTSYGHSFVGNVRFPEPLVHFKLLHWMSLCLKRSDCKNVYHP